MTDEAKEGWMKHPLTKLGIALIMLLLGINGWFIERLVSQVDATKEAVITLSVATKGFEDVVKDFGNVKSRLAVLEYAFDNLKKDVDSQREDARDQRAERRPAGRR